MLSRWLPFLAWPRPTRVTLRDDVIAGLTVALVALPQALAHAQLAGVPPYWGLYAVLLPTVVGALFGSSPQLSTGTVAMSSLLTAASVMPIALPGSEKFLACVVLLALLSGFIQLALGWMRLGVLLNFLSHPVLIGFINAAAVLIALSQLPLLTGVKLGAASPVLQSAWDIVRNPGIVHLPSFAFGVAAIVAQLGLRRISPRFPGVLVTAAIATYVSWSIGFEAAGGAVVGAIPSGLPGISLPLAEAIELLPAAFVLALISFMEATSSARVIAAKTHRRWDENQELIGQGLAKISAALCHTLPVSASFARSALNQACHAKTGLSSVVCAGTVLLFLLFFTDLLYHLPLPVLAAIIIVPVASVIDLRGMRQAWRASRDDGIACIVTFGATLLFAPNIQNGAVIGIILSLMLLLYRRTRPRAIKVGLHGDGMLRDAKRWELPELHPRLAALRWDDSLLFVNCAYFEEAVLALARAHPQARCVLIAAGGINDLDASGVFTLENVRHNLATSGVTLALSAVKKQVQDVLDRTGLAASIGAQNIFTTDQQALDALIARLDAGAGN
jgi:SulP family sulfate permease